MIIVNFYIGDKVKYFFRKEIRSAYLDFISQLVVKYKKAVSIEGFAIPFPYLFDFHHSLSARIVLKKIAAAEPGSCEKLQVGSF